MTEMELYKLWSSQDLDDPDLKKELEEIAGDEEAIKDRFYQTLAFGTAGLRGVLGAGTNRMNIYVVRQATQGLADYLNAKYDSPKSASAMTAGLRATSLPKRPPGSWLPMALPLCFTAS